MRRIRARPPPRRPRHRCAAAPGSSSTGTPAASAAGRGRPGTLPAVAETAAPTAADSAPEAAPAAAAPSEVPTTDPMTLALPTVPPFRCQSRLSVAPVCRACLSRPYDTSDAIAVQVLHADSTRLAKPMITQPA